MELLTLNTNPLLDGMRTTINVGESIALHMHPHAHYVDLVVGAVDVQIDGVTTHYIAPARIDFPAYSAHKFTATLPGTIVDMWHDKTAVADSEQREGWIHKAL